MTLDIFKRMTKGVLSRLGEGSLLRGTIPCSVALEHGVETQGMDTHGNQVIYQRSIATIDRDLAPKSGDVLTHPDGNYILDVMYVDDGMSVDFIVRKA